MKKSASKSLSVVLVVRLVVVMVLVFWGVPGGEWREVLADETPAGEQEGGVAAQVENGLSREVWLATEGGGLAQNLDLFLTTPSFGDVVSGGDGFGSGFSGDYLSRTRGVVVAPQSGDFQFSLSSGAEAEVWVSTDGSAGQAQRVISTGGSLVDNFSDPARQSGVISFVSGQSYYIEVRQRVLDGDEDFLCLAWKRPFGVDWEIVPFLSTGVFVPGSGDPYGFGYPSAWLESSGLSELDLAEQAPWADPNGDGVSNLEHFRANTDPLEVFVVEIPGETEVVGKLLWERWTDIEGPSVDQLRSATGDFRLSPASKSFLSGASTTSDSGDNYGERFRGYITVPSSGEYTFYITADESAELWISTTGSKWEKAKVASVLFESSGRNQWMRDSRQKSLVYNFTAGQKIYVEILHKERWGGDHVQLGWAAPGAAGVVEVPASVLSSYVLDSSDLDDDDLPDDWETANGISATDNGSTDAANGKHGVRNSLGLTNFQCYKNDLSPATGLVLAGPNAGQRPAFEISGSFLREKWNGIANGSVSNFLANSHFRDASDAVLFTTPDAAFTPSGAATVGERWRAWFTAPETGVYRFGLHANRAARLYLSTDSTVKNKHPIANLPAAVGAYSNVYSEQQSVPIPLVAGQRYYIEILFAGGDEAPRCELTWAPPWNDWTPLPSAPLSSYTEDPALDRLGYSLQWLSQNNFSANSLAYETTQPGALLNNWQAYRAGSFNGANLAAAHGLLRDYWFNVYGGGIDAHNNLFLTSPARRDFVQGGDNFASQIGDNYIDRTRGYIVVPTTGFYSFAISNDDEAEMYLSTDSNPVNIRKLITTIYTDYDDWSAEHKRSPYVHLKAGERYYLEIVHHQGGGVGYLRLAWQTPESEGLCFVPASATRPFVPPADDPLGFGYPQSWLQSYGLSGLPLEQQAPWADPTGGGLTNLEKYNLGLDPLALDSDGDGISDYEEVKLAGTNPNAVDFDGTSEEVLTINGADFVNGAGTIGNWQRTGTSAYAADTRGTLSYAVNLPSEGVFRLVITGGQYFQSSDETTFPLDIYADNRYVGRTVLKDGTAVVWLPHLSVGAHTLRLTWLNGTAGTSLRVDSLAFEARGGTWLTSRQRTLSFVDPTPLSSYTSPYCLEGRAPLPSLLETLTTYAPAANATDAYSVYIRDRFFSGSNTPAPGGSGTPQLPFAQTGLRGTFFNEIPLSPSSSVTVFVGDTSVGTRYTKILHWQAIDLVVQAGSTFTIRAGDSLLLQSPGAITQIFPDGNSAPVLPVIGLTATPVVFTQAGRHILATSLNGEHPRIAVEVVGADLTPEPTAIVGQSRPWTPTLLPPEAELVSDPETFIGASGPPESSVVTRLLNLFTNSTLPQRILARLGENGPILSAATINALQHYGNTKNTWDIVQTYPDGSELWRGELSFSGTLPADFRVEITPYLSGILFDDGLPSLTLTAGDFDSTGTRVYYVHKSPGSTGSVCHTIEVYSGATLLWKTDL